jgi:polygalacturonase
LDPSRRTRVVAALGLVALLFAPATLGAQDAAASDPWARLPGILAGIKARVFPARDVLITDFGARPDGSTLATAAIDRAIAACAARAAGAWWCRPESS